MGTRQTARGPGWSLSVINLVLDAALLVAFMALCFAAVVDAFGCRPQGVGGVRQPRAAGQQT